MDEWATMCKTQTCKFLLCNEDTWMIFLCKVDRSKVDRYEWGEKYTDRDICLITALPKLTCMSEVKNKLIEIFPGSHSVHVFVRTQSVRIYTKI